MISLNIRNIFFHMTMMLLCIFSFKNNVWAMDNEKKQIVQNEIAQQRRGTISNTGILNQKDNNELTDHLEYHMKDSQEVQNNGVNIKTIRKSIVVTSDELQKMQKINMPNKQTPTENKLIDLTRIGLKANDYIIIQDKKAKQNQNIIIDFKLTAETRKIFDTFFLSPSFDDLIDEFKKSLVNRKIIAALLLYAHHKYFNHKTPALLSVHIEEQGGGLFSYTMNVNKEKFSDFVRDLKMVIKYIQLDEDDEEVAKMALKKTKAYHALNNLFNEKVKHIKEHQIFEKIACELLYNQEILEFNVDHYIGAMMRSVQLKQSIAASCLNKNMCDNIFYDEQNSLQNILKILNSSDGFSNYQYNNIMMTLILLLKQQDVLNKYGQDFIDSILAFKQENTENINKINNVFTRFWNEDRTNCVNFTKKIFDIEYNLDLCYRTEIKNTIHQLKEQQMQMAHKKSCWNYFCRKNNLTQESRHRQALQELATLERKITDVRKSLLVVVDIEQKPKMNSEQVFDIEDQSQQHLEHHDENQELQMSQRGKNDKQIEVVIELHKNPIEKVEKKSKCVIF